MSAKKGFFITGTDTDVGKTLVTAGVLSRLLDAGVDTVPMKPIQTGCPRQADGNLGNLDLDVCYRLAGITPDPEEMQWAAPYRFAPACSPHLAAETAGRHIEFDSICAAAAELMNRHERVLVEGAGGVLVPIDRKKTMLDLMVALDLPVIVAARPGLGTINHTLLTLRELYRAGLTVHGVVFCATEPRPRGAIEQDNRRTVKEFGGTDVLGCIPYLVGLTDGSLTPQKFKTIATEALSGSLTEDYACPAGDGCINQEHRQASPFARPMPSPTYCREK